MSLRLDVPRPEAKPDPKAELRPLFLEEWVESLPYASPPTLARHLLTALARLNRSPVKPATRLALLELHLRPYRFLLEQSRQQDLSATNFERLRAQTESMRRLAAALADGYKLSLVTAERRRFGKDRDLALGLQRAMLCIAHGLLHAYEAYLPSPEGHWCELAELYRHAGEAGLAERALGPGPVHPGPVHEEFAASPAHLYRRILLTAAIDPYRLGRGELQRVFAMLGPLADEARLEPLRAVERPAGRFVVDPASDARPRPYAAHVPEMAAGRWLLDATPVIERFQRQLREHAAPAAERALIGRMVRALGLPPRRHTPRELASGPIEVAVGLHAVHHFLMGAGSGHGASEREARTHGSGGQPDSRDIDREDGIELGAELAPRLAAPTHRSETWTLVDRGPGGLGILRSTRPTVPVTVGELVGILAAQAAAGARRWQLGVVRWLNISEDGEYHVGVQLIARAAEPCTVRREERARQPADDYNALAVPGLDAGPGTTLITPRGLHLPGVQLLVSGRRKTLRVGAGALIEASTSFERFRYEPLPEASQSEPSQSEP